MVTRLGTYLGTDLGTDLGSFPDAFDTTQLYALSSISAANYYQTLAGGGEAGDAAGFGGVALVIPRALQATNQLYAGRLSASAGWQTGVVNTNDFSLYTWPFLQVSNKLGAAKVGRVLVDIFQTTAATSRIVQDRLDTSTSTALASYTPASGASVEQIGMAGSASPSTATDHLGHLRWRGTPTDTHLTALADLIRTLGDVPSRAAADAIFKAVVTDADVAALAPVHWYDAGTVTPSGPNLLSMTNLGSAGGTLTVGAGTVLLPTADAALDGKPSITLDGVNHYLTSSLPASAWRFLHDGTGAEVFCVFVPTALPTNQVYWATGAAGNGVGAAHYSSNTLLSYLIQNGTGTTAQLVNLGALVIGTPVYTDSVFGLGETPDMTNRLKSVLVSGGVDVSLAPAAGDSLSTLRVGSNYAGGQRCAMRLAAWIGFNRVLTPAQRATMQQYITTRWAIDRTSTTHRWSLRDVLAGLGTPVIDGQVAPASLPDTVTAASVDAMARTGAPVVRVIDPGVDGRKTYGALGFSATSHLRTTVAILNTATISVEVRLIFASALASSKHILSNANGSGVVGGFSLYQSANTLNLYSYGAGALVGSVVIPAVDIGYPRTVKIEYTGAAWRLHLDGVQQGADNAAIHTPSSLNLYVGTFGDGTSPSDNVSILSVRAGTYAAPNQHFYDLTQDIVANGGPSAGIPATVLDRVGTDHLTKVGGLATIVNGSATGLRNFVAATNILATPVGFAGAASFWASALAAPQTLTGIRILFSKSNHSTVGWSFGFNGSYIVTYIADGGVNTAGPQFNMGAGSGYLNTPTHIAMVLSGGTLTLYVNGVAVGTPLAVAAYSPGTTSMVIGANNGGALHPATGVDIFGACGGHFAPTAGEIATAAAASLSTGTITAVPGKTSHRYDLKADIADAGGAVPTRSVERTSGVDPMVVVNAKLEAASRVERLWSYETSPIMHGARNWSGANYLSVAGGIAAGAVTSYWFAIALVINAKAGTAFQVVACKANAAGSQGYNVYTSGTNGTLTFSHGNGAAPVTGGSYVIGTAAVGKVLLAFGQWTGAATQFYVDRVKQGSDTATAGYTAYAGAFNLGRHPDPPNSNPATDNITVLGFMGGNNAYLTLAEVQAACDAFVVNEDLVAVPGKTDRLWSVKRAQNGSLQPILDAQGSGETLAITGAPTLHPLYSRAFNW